MLKLVSNTNPKDFVLVKKQLSDSEVRKLYKAIVTESENKLKYLLNIKDYRRVACIATALDKLSDCISYIENDIGGDWINKLIETQLWIYYREFLGTYIDTEMWDEYKSSIL